MLIARLGNFVIAIDEEDADNLKKLYTDAAYLKTVGGISAYQQFAASKAMMGAGEGMAKGGGAGKSCGHCGGALQAAEQPSSSPTAFCTGCGGPLGPDAGFCGQCRQKR